MGRRETAYQHFSLAPTLSLLTSNAFDASPATIFPPPLRNGILRQMQRTLLLRCTCQLLLYRVFDQSHQIGGHVNCQNSWKDAYMCTIRCTPTHTCDTIHVFRQEGHGTFQVSAPLKLWHENLLDIRYLTIARGLPPLDRMSSRSAGATK